ncbi:hypothetical protein D9M70_366720 [compost metagenome]
MKRTFPWLPLVAALFANSALSAQPPAAAGALPVSVDNYRRAETDRVFAGIAAQGGFGQFRHNRGLTPLDKQVVLRGNRDTLYSIAVFDLDAGPVDIRLPDPGQRFMTLMTTDQDHYTVGVSYGGGHQRLTREQVGTRYVLAALRILVDPNDPADLARVHALQDAVRVSQAGSGRLETPKWDAASRQKVHDALVTLGTTLPDLRKGFGSREQVDPVHHLIATAAAWGGNPEKDAVYLNVTPARNDGKTRYRLTVKDVPVDGFWSISLYNEQGYFEPNPLNAYSLNNLTARKAADGSVVVQFGGCDGKTPNCLPIMPGWNYMVRLFRPRAEILDGSWHFPVAQAVD